MAGKRFVTVQMTPELMARAVSAVDWAKIDATGDAEIAAQIAGDPDTAPLLSDEAHAASQVKLLRRRLGLTQAGFAARFRVPLGTLRDWEQGRRQPDAPALALLRVIEREPEAAMRALGVGRAA